MNKEYVVLRVKKDDVEESINGLTNLKPILQQQVKLVNGKNVNQGEIDARDIGKHFDTAIQSMIMVYNLSENAKENKAENMTNFDKFKDIDYVAKLLNEYCCCSDEVCLNSPIRADNSNCPYGDNATDENCIECTKMWLMRKCKIEGCAI